MKQAFFQQQFGSRDVSSFLKCQRGPITYKTHPVIFMYTFEQIAQMNDSANVAVKNEQKFDPNGRPLCQ